MIEVSTEDIKVLRAAILKFGAKEQLRQLQEECAELIVATNHSFRGCKNAADEFIEEFVDVYIVMFQLFLDVKDKDKSKFLQIFDYKITCLKKRLSKEVKND